MKIKAINTQYKGYNFRSRTEARWAVFFDELGFKWEYEREGYHLPCGKYLPDFYFTKEQVYLEVKGQAFTTQEKQKCKELSLVKGTSMVIMLDGVPGQKSYEAFVNGEEISEIIFIPEGVKYHPFFYGYDFDEEYFPETV